MNSETNQKRKTKHKKLKITLAVIASLAVLLFIAGAVYVNDYYRATDEAYECLNETDSITVTELDNKNMVFAPEDANTGFIFYPGGKVEYTAYAPLMHELAEQGILCVLVKMPFNLAVLDQNAADGIQAMYPEIETWYIGGHSLGGAMAATYAAKHAKEYAGLVLLAAYSTADLTDSDLSVLSIYGSKDEVLNADKMDKYAENLPNGTITKVIEGGCHSYFGSYGAQSGDGTPSITPQEQIKQTVDAIMQLKTAR